MYPENRVHCLGFYQTGFSECGAGSKFGTSRRKLTTNWSWMQCAAIFLIMPISGPGNISDCLEDLLSGTIFFVFSFLFVNESHNPVVGVVVAGTEVKLLASATGRNVCCATC